MAHTPFDTAPSNLFQTVLGFVGLLFRLERHVLGLIFGGIRAWARSHEKPYPRFHGMAGMIGAIASPFLAPELKDLPFPVQLRRRLEILGPTYIKLGQVLSLREDLFPTAITDELKNLLDRLACV